MEKESVEKKDEITRLYHLGNVDEAIMKTDPFSFKASDFFIDRILGLFSHSPT